MLLGVARPELVPLPVLRLTALSRAGGVGAGLRPPATGRFVGGTGGVDRPAAAPTPTLSIPPLIVTDGVGRGAATGGGGGGGGGARDCSISSTYAEGVQP